MVGRPLVLRALTGVVAVVLLGGSAALAAPATAVADPPAQHAGDSPPPEYDAPLLITIDSMTPGAVPNRGAIRISGTIINRDVEIWRDINLHPFINAGVCAGCPPPVTTTTELAAAAEADPDALVGERIIEIGHTVDELEPGAVATYSLRVPRSLLGVSQAGVYWFGVHAIGSSDSTPRDLLADGRARTFLPYIPRGTRGKVDTAVVVPLRHRITHTAAGAIGRSDDWEEDLASDGTLGGPLAFGAAAAGRPVTWLLDPALPDAAQRLANGNPPRSLGPADGGEEGDGEGSADGQTSDDAETDGEDEEPGDTSPTATAARRWLASLQVQLREEEVLTVPYGDLDMSATADEQPELYPVARARAGEVLTEWGTPTTSVIGSPGGYLDPSAFATIDDDSLFLITDRMFGLDGYPSGPPKVGRYGAHPVAVTSYGAAAGGPDPNPRLTPLALRQRVLSEAALRLIDPSGRRPLVMVLPKHVDATDAAEFWTGLDEEWLNLTTVSDATDRRQREIDPEKLSYPPDQELAELDAEVFDELDQLMASGATLQNVLTEGDGIVDQVLDEALTGASYSFRNSQSVAVNNLSRSRQWIERRLRDVRIDAPPGVTLSSADGSFAATITNDLEETVTVRIAATSSSDGVTVDVGEPVVLAGESRTTILLDTHTSGLGVHNVTLTLTDLDGTPIGSVDQVPIRSGQVGDVIWVIIGVGGGILVIAIAIRLFRRIRKHRRGAVA